MPIKFANKSQLGAFGEFVYKRYCESLGFKVDRTNYCHTDFILSHEKNDSSQFVDVKATLTNKAEYKGKRYHKEIAYELIVLFGDEILLSPDRNSPLYGEGRHSLGSIGDWLTQWDQNTEIVRKRERRLADSNIRDLKKLFSSTAYPKIRIVERGDASGKRWTGTVDNLPGSCDLIKKNDATIFIEFGCKDFVEEVSKIYLIWHHLLQRNKIKMAKLSSRQINKGIVEVIDLKAFVSEYPEFVFDNIATLNQYIKNRMEQSPAQWLPR